MALFEWVYRQWTAIEGARRCTNVSELPDLRIAALSQCVLLEINHVARARRLPLVDTKNALGHLSWWESASVG